MSPIDSPPDFEKSLKRLEKLVQRMEAGEQSLDAALKDFEQGIALVRQCRAGLDHAEQRVEVLLQQTDGDALTESLSPAPANAPAGGDA